jgi:hypothetical protein
MASFVKTEVVYRALSRIGPTGERDDGGMGFIALSRCCRAKNGAITRVAAGARDTVSLDGVPPSSAARFLSGMFCPSAVENAFPLSLNASRNVWKRPSLGIPQVRFAAAKIRRLSE